MLGISGGMFVLELVAGLLAWSVALLADSLDMLGDTLVYGFSLFVIGKAAHWRARSALLKGGIMAGFGLGVLGQGLSKLLVPTLPEAGLMGAAALLASSAVMVVTYWPYTLLLTRLGVHL